MTRVGCITQRQPVVGGENPILHDIIGGSPGEME